MTDRAYISRAFQFSDKGEQAKIWADRPWEMCVSLAKIYETLMEEYLFEEDPRSNLEHRPEAFLYLLSVDDIRDTVRIVTHLRPDCPFDPDVIDKTRRAIWYKFGLDVHANADKLNLWGFLGEFRTQLKALSAWATAAEIKYKAASGGAASVLRLLEIDSAGCVIRRMGDRYKLLPPVDWFSCPERWSCWQKLIKAPGYRMRGTEVYDGSKQSRKSLRSSMEDDLNRLDISLGRGVDWHISDLSPKTGPT